MNYRIFSFGLFTFSFFLFLDVKELSLCNNLKYLNPYIFATGWFEALMFQNKIIQCKRINSLKKLRSTTLGTKDIGIRKSGFVAKTQFLYTIMYRFKKGNSSPNLKNLSGGLNLSRGLNMVGST